MQKKQVVFLILCAVALTGCADPNTLTDSIRPGLDAPAGFWRGLWHGVCAPFALFGIMFGMDIGIYEVFNSGNWYNFGFLLGVGAFSYSATSKRS